MATVTPSPQGILHILLPVHFLQEATSSLPLMLKYSTNQPLRSNKQYTVLPFDRQMVMTRNVCYSLFSRSRHSISPFILRRSGLLFFRVFFFTSILTKLTDGTLWFVCPDGEWHYRLIGTSRQRRRYLFTYFFCVFQARGGTRKASAERESRSSCRA